MFKKILIYLFFIFLLFSSYLVAYSKSIQNDISENIIRLHIIANSDTPKDQEIKLKIRDKILEHMSSHKFTTRKEAYSYLSNNLDTLQEISNTILKEHNFSYTSKILLEESFFPAKSYGDVSLPSGKYTSIKILLGDSIGKNWWCVMFPPLCFSDVSSGILPKESKNTLEDNLSNESFSLVSSDVEIRFKIVDFINSL